MLRRFQASFVLLCLASVPAVAQEPEPANDAASSAPPPPPHDGAAVGNPAGGPAGSQIHRAAPHRIRAAGTWS